MRAIFIILGILLIYSCEDQYQVDFDCLEQKLEDFDMVPYNNEDIGCAFYVELLVLNGTQYYHVDSHCADVQANLQDCWGTQYCNDDTSDLCTSIYANAERLGIVGYGE